jgi:competence protein ComEA
MAELQRPLPVSTVWERVSSQVRFVGGGRLVSAAGSVLLVAAGCWWLLKAPAPPIEAGIPLASGVTAPGRLSTASTTVALAPLAPPAGPTSSSVPTSPAPLDTIVVQAAGAVAVPGVYTVPLGSRVHQLIAAAGGAGPNADLDALALASVMIDGQRILVPVVGSDTPPMPAPTPTGLGAPSPPNGGDARSTPAGPLDLNSAAADQLDTLPGVGPATAAAIVAWRDQNGPFASPDDLLKVRGIGPAKLDAIRGLVTT